MTNYKLSVILIFVCCLSGSEFLIGRLKYEGGGDWYSNPSSVNNLLKFVSKETAVNCSEMEGTAVIGENLSSYPYLYLTGHGTIDLNDNEAESLRKHLMKGGFLHADDNYGLDQSFRKLVKKIFPEKDLVTVPFDHPVYNIKYKFPNGLPKIHEHDGKNPEGLGIFHNGRLVLFYSYESDLGDGWEDREVHNDPEEKRLQALKMGCNLVLYYLESFK
jgi:hypothetical protein